MTSSPKTAKQPIYRLAKDNVFINNNNNNLNYGKETRNDRTTAADNGGVSAQSVRNSG
jgi:hypothetical protein